MLFYLLFLVCLFTEGLLAQPKVSKMDTIEYEGGGKSTHGGLSLIKKNNLFGAIHHTKPKTTLKTKYDTMFFANYNDLFVSQKGQKSVYSVKNREGLKIQIKEVSRIDPVGGRHYIAVKPTKTGNKFQLFGKFFFQKEFWYDTIYPLPARGYDLQHFIAHQGDKRYFLDDDGRIVDELPKEAENIRKVCWNCWMGYEVIHDGISMASGISVLVCRYFGYAYQLKNAWGLVFGWQKKGKKDTLDIRLPPMYDVPPIVCAEDKFLVCRNGKYGLVNAQNQPLTDFDWEYATQTENYQILVKKNGRYGIFTPDLVPILEVKYENIASFMEHEDTNIFVATDSTQTRFLSIEPEHISQFLEIPEEEEIFENQPVVLPFWRIDQPFNLPLTNWKFDKLKRLIDGFYCADVAGTQPIISTFPPEKIDSVLRRTSYNYHFFKDCIIQNPKGLYGWVDLYQKKIRIACEYDTLIMADKNSEQAYFIFRKKNAWGLLSIALDSLNNPPAQCLTPVYEQIVKVYAGYELVVAKKNNLYGLLNLKGEVLIDFISPQPLIVSHYHDRADWINSNKLFCFPVWMQTFDEPHYNWSGDSGEAPRPTYHTLVCLPYWSADLTNLNQWEQNK
jgi:hypothetical protein